MSNKNETSTPLVASDERSANEQSLSFHPLNYVNLAAYAINTIVTYGIGASGWFDLPSNAQLSAKYQTLVTPAGYAFGIWGLIFVAQLLWVLWPLWVPQQRQAPAVVQAVQYNYLAVCLAQVGWTVAFSHEWIAVSVIMMVTIGFFLYRIVSNFDSTNKSWLQEFPFSLHFGWILAATAVNVNVWLVYFGVNDTTLYGAALISLLAVLVVAAWQTLRSYVVVPSVVAWALWGIYNELASPAESIAQTFSSQQIQTVRYSALASMTFLLGGIVVKALWQCRRERR